MLSPFTYNPLRLLLFIFISALRVLLFICFFFGTVYGLITFLIYVTGILVLFSYILRMFPNFAVNLQRGVFWIGVPLIFNTWFFLDPPFAEETLVSALVGGSNLSAYFGLILALFFRLVAITVLCFKGRRPLRSR